MNTKKTLENYYEKKYSKIDTSDALTWPSPSETYTWYRMKKSIEKFFLEELRRKNSLNVIDFGCGDGRGIFTLSRLVPENRKVTFNGIDISKNVLKYAETMAKKAGVKCSFKQADAEKFKEDKKFDVVISSEVIEHLPNPEKYVGNIYDSLKEDGVIIITTPNKNHILSKFYKSLMPGSLKRQIESESLSGHHEHISLQKSGELKNLLEKSGFKIEKCQRGTILYGQRWVDNRPIFSAFMHTLDVILPKSFFLDLGWNVAIKARKVR